MGASTFTPSSWTKNYGSPYTLVATLALDKGVLTSYGPISVTNISPNTFNVGASGSVQNGTMTFTVSGSAANTTVTWRLSVRVYYDDSGVPGDEQITQDFSLTIGDITGWTQSTPYIVVTNNGTPVAATPYVCLGGSSWGQAQMYVYK